MEFQKIENKERVEVNNDCKNIIINNCKYINLYNINSEFCFIYNCKECYIVNCNINNLFINDNADILTSKFNGEIKKYNYKIKENKIFSFHF